MTYKYIIYTGSYLIRNTFIFDRIKANITRMFVKVRTNFITYVEYLYLKYKYFELVNLNMTEKSEIERETYNPLSIKHINRILIYTTS